MITTSDNRYSAWVHTLNGITKLSSNNSFELHISKVAPFSRNQGPPKIKSGSGQSGPTTMNSLAPFFALNAGQDPHNSGQNLASRGAYFRGAYYSQNGVFNVQRGFTMIILASSDQNLTNKGSLDSSRQDEVNGGWPISLGSIDAKI
ncbi:unnamed protein product [Rhizophagus irregularis]|nr:unnamed protein product [Rhizophagus irregularis]